MTILATILTAMVMLGAPPAQIETLDGTRYTGQLRALSPENAQIKTSDGLETVPIDRLISITFSENGQASPRNNQPKGKIFITLVDGSKIVARDYRVDDATAHISVVGDPHTLAIPTRDVDTVRFTSAATNLKKAWKQLQKKETHSDRLVVAKDDSLDYHEGTIGDITDSRVLFSLDGDPMKVKRRKVFGITYYHSAGRDLPKPLGYLETSAGSRWALVFVAIDGDRFHLKTPTGLERSLAMDQTDRIHFAEGKIAYLSDLQPESVTWTPYLTGGDPTKIGDNEARKKLFGPKFNKSFQAGPLVLGGKTYPKGIAIHSRSVLIYRLDKKYGRLTATAGIADRVRPRGNVQLIIQADDRVLLDRDISGTEDPVPLDLDLTNADRLIITVDFGRQIDIADRLILGDAKVME